MIDWNVASTFTLAVGLLRICPGFFLCNAWCHGNYQQAEARPGNSVLFFPSGYIATCEGSPWRFISILSSQLVSMQLAS